MKDKTDFKWVLIVTILAFIISIVMTLFSTLILDSCLNISIDLGDTSSSHFDWKATHGVLRLPRFLMLN